MAGTEGYETTTKFGQELAYDLRQTYARIVGEHLTDIAEARKQENFYVWFKNLEDLYTIVRHKFKDIKKESGEYLAKKNNVIKLANEHRSVWLGQSKEVQPHANIENALREIETFLYEKMNDAKMFGSTGHNAQI